MLPDTAHACKWYFDDPDELNAIYDYGVILLGEGDLELLAEDPQSFEDTSEISFVPIPKDKVSTHSLLLPFYFPLLFEGVF